jgi:bacterioferritin
MKGNKEVLEFLNDCLKAELTAIHQYFVHSKMCENWGFTRLAGITFREAVGEMNHAQELIQRILFLDGTPAAGELAPLQIGKTVKEQLENDLALELEALPRLNAAITKAAEVGDNGSKELFQRILYDEEIHVDFLEAQLNIIEQIGIANYLAQQMRADEKGEPGEAEGGAGHTGH